MELSVIDKGFIFVKSFMLDGGPLMWFTLFLWLLGIALVVYKYLELKCFDINAEKFFDLIQNDILGNSVENAIKNCGHSKSVLPKIIKVGLMRANEPKELVENALNAAILEHTPKLSYKLSYISLVASLSPLMGLLGTILGIITSFVAVASVDPSMKAQQLALGISTAMNNTALGLLAAISVMILHAMLASKAQRIVDETEAVATKLLDLLIIRRQRSGLIDNQ
ncbi:MAG: MotA/TolQ/ExbB proton channel family protein [Oligoflexia bacterium]|nr:MotA/TolQ/ExbB proton channel family protein [Oligoflexia bacterium]